MYDCDINTIIAVALTGNRLHEDGSGEEQCDNRRVPMIGWGEERGGVKGERRDRGGRTRAFTRRWRL